MKYRVAFILSGGFHGLALAGTIIFNTYSGLISNKPQPISIVFLQPGEMTPEGSKDSSTKTPSTKKQTIKDAKRKKSKAIKVSKQDVETAYVTAVDCVPFEDNATPTYPTLAKKQGIEATFELVLTINKYGHVIRVDCVDQEMIPEILYLAAAKTVWDWRFHRSQTSTQQLVVPIRFVLA